MDSLIFWTRVVIYGKLHSLFFWLIGIHDCMITMWLTLINKSIWSFTLVKLSKTPIARSLICPGTKYVSLLFRLLFSPQTALSFLHFSKSNIFISIEVISFSSRFWVLILVIFPHMLFISLV